MINLVKIEEIFCRLPFQNKYSGKQSSKFKILASLILIQTDLKDKLQEVHFENLIQDYNNIDAFQTLINLTKTFLSNILSSVSDIKEAKFK